eukprot:TRINITY_DN9662_c0_g1_i4.p1 TRINITY_DN9662_c0_g1~~TRINITY_DN9662_c0_g1_i4.p1  ORF type:complete len:291 (+),score=24.77 TRINITY_DN9662_c0_g1_i4:83-955(+)
MELLNEKTKKQEEMVQMLLKDRDQDTKRSLHFATSPRIIVRGGAAGGGVTHHGSFTSPRKISDVSSTTSTRSISTSVSSTTTYVSTTLSPPILTSDSPTTPVASISTSTPALGPAPASSTKTASSITALSAPATMIDDGSGHGTPSSKYSIDLKRRDSEPLEPQPDPDIDVDSNFFASQGVILPKEPSSSPPRRSSLLQRIISVGTTPLLQKLKRGSQTNIPLPPAYTSSQGPSTTGTPLVLKSASSSHIPSLASPPRTDVTPSLPTSMSKIGRAVQQECRDRSRMPSSA